MLSRPVTEPVACEYSLIINYTWYIPGTSYRSLRRLFPIATHLDISLQPVAHGGIFTFFFQALNLLIALTALVALNNGRERVRRRQGSEVLPHVPV